MFRRILSRRDRGRRAAVDFVVCFGCGGISSFFFRFLSPNAHGLLHIRGHRDSFTSLLVPGCVQGALIVEFVYLYVCMCNISVFYRLRELYEADFHKSGIYGSGRVWANAWDVFRRETSRGGRGRRAVADFRGVIWVRRDFVIFFSSNAHGLLQV